MMMLFDVIVALVIIHEMEALDAQDLFYKC